MFQASSAHLQEDIVVYMQHMVLSLSMRVPGGLSVHSFFMEADISLPQLTELDASSTDDLLLHNSHFSISYPSPLMPSVIQVGGLHITEPIKLPEVSMGNIKIMVNLR